MVVGSNAKRKQLFASVLAEIDTLRRDLDRLYVSVACLRRLAGRTCDMNSSAALWVPSTHHRTQGTAPSSNLPRLASELIWQVLLRPYWDFSYGREKVAIYL